MQRAFLLAMICPPAVAGAEPPSEAAAALCRGQSQIEIALEGDEFHLEAYDAGGGLAQVVPASEIPGQPGLNLHWASNKVLVPMAPGTFDELVQAQRAGQLRLEAAVERLPTNDGAPRAPCESSVDVVPTAVWLQLGSLPVAERDLRKPPPPIRIMQPEVRIGNIHAEEGHPAVDPDRLAERMQPVAEQCLSQALHSLPALQGALTMELERSPVGERVRPRMAVDGLSAKNLSDCLEGALFTDDGVWEAMPEGALVIVPFYFRGVPLTLPATSAALPSGTNAP